MNNSMLRLLIFLPILALPLLHGPTLAHDHCSDFTNPLRVPKGVVVGDGDLGRLENRGEFPRKRCAPGVDGGVNCTE